MVSVLPELRRHDLEQLALDRKHILAGRQTGAIRYPENMRVDRDRRLAESRVEDDVCGLAPDPGKTLEGLARRRHFTPMLFHQLRACLKNVLRLGPIEPDAPNMVLYPPAPELEHRGGRGGGLEQSWSRKIDAAVRGLCREHDGYQQLERGTEIKFGTRGRILRPQALEQALDITRLQDGMRFRGVGCAFYRLSAALKGC